MTRDEELADLRNRLKCARARSRYHALSFRPSRKSGGEGLELAMADQRSLALAIARLGAAKPRVVTYSRHT